MSMLCSRSGAPETLGMTSSIRRLQLSASGLNVRRSAFRRRFFYRNFHVDGQADSCFDGRVYDVEAQVGPDGRR